MKFQLQFTNGYGRPEPLNEVYCDRKSVSTFDDRETDPAAALAKCMAGNFPLQAGDIIRVVDVTDEV